MMSQDREALKSMFNYKITTNRLLMSILTPVPALVRGKGGENGY